MAETTTAYVARLRETLYLVTCRITALDAVIEASRNRPASERGPEFAAALTTHGQLCAHARSLRETIANPEPREP